jgi:hypothetical protein
MALEIRADAASATGMMAEELRCFCRVVRGQQSVPVGATYADALQVQQWMDRLAASAGNAAAAVSPPRQQGMTWQCRRGI